MTRIESLNKSSVTKTLELERVTNEEREKIPAKICSDLIKTYVNDRR